MSAARMILALALLVGTGLPVAAVAPAALAFHLCNLPSSARSPTACSLAVDGAIAPNWVLGLACGAG